MRIGQTSLVVFASKIVGSIAGFVATLYIARLLGPTVLGVYSLVLTVLAWLGIVGNLGVTGAVQKRMSEGDDTSEFLIAGALSLLVIFVVLSGVLYAVRGPIEAYIGRPVFHFLLLLLFVTLLNGLSEAALSGSHLVHIQGMLIPLRMTIGSITKIALVFLGFKLTGMLVGHALGFALVGLVGITIAGPALRVPSRHHFEALFSYAQYSWLGAVEGRAFGWVDVTVMGFFVSADLIGVYSVAWTISTFLLASGSAIGSTIFPEISNLTSEGETQMAAPILRDALTYAGVILIPGLVGATILGPRILRIYGSEFTVGTTVLTLLVVAVLLRSYQNQLTTTLNAVDRPDLTFRLNLLFVGSNLLLNVLLVYLYGWIGAAVATALSAGLAAVFAYYYVAQLIDFEFPTRPVAKQVASAGVMGLVVAGCLWLENTYALLGHNFALVLLVVAIGAGTYFAMLFTISTKFRHTVRENLPADVPGLR